MTDGQKDRLVPLLRAAARGRQIDGELEVDDDADVSLSDAPEAEGGAYVQAWLWVPLTEDMYALLASAKEGL